MKLKYSMFLFVMGLCVGSLAAVWVRAPGYMDAAYYYTTALPLAGGEGFVEPFIWNYLSDPAGIPHPSHLYWHPLASILASIPLRFGPPTFRVAQSIFILLTGFIPVLVFLLAHNVTGSMRSAVHAGFLGLVPGFYLPFFVTTDNFVVYAVVGTAALWLMGEAAERTSPWMWLAGGAAAGISHLARADGLLLLAPAIILLYRKPRSFRFLLILTTGFVMAAGPWWLRNLHLTGSVLGSSGSGMAWMTEYDQLFRYPAEPLTLEMWLQSDPMDLIRVRAEAVWNNLLSLIVVNGLVILGPFMLLGGYQLRHRAVVRAAGIYTVLLFISMSLVFPLAGYRGAFFHSSAALMPVSWALVPVGFSKFLDWGTAHRGWEKKRSSLMFAPVLVVAAVLLTGWNYYNKVLGDDPGRLRWQENHDFYVETGRYVESIGTGEGLTAVKDPPSFFAATGMSSIVIPYGSPETLREVCQRYGVDWVILDKDHPAGLSELYEDPDGYSWLEVREVWEDSDESPVYFLQVQIVRDLE